MSPKTLPRGGEGRYLLVLDVNIYLDVVRIAGGACALDDLPALRGEYPNRPVLDLISYVLSGKRPNGEPLEVWTSNHINYLVALKASQPNSMTIDERDRGLGLPEAEAQAVVDNFVWPLVDATGGDIVPVERSSESPPLDHEDGLVHATARSAGYQDAFYERRVCITRDRGFLDADTGHVVEKYHPSEWVIAHRQQRSEAKMRALLRTMRP